MAVGIPRMHQGAVEVDAVFSSSPGDAWTLLRKGRLPAVSIYAAPLEFHRGIDGRLVNGVLVSVDLVRSGADKAAKITGVADGADLTPAQRQVQRNFDDYLWDPKSPLGANLFDRAESHGPDAMEPLRSVVAPLLGESTEQPVPTGRARPVPLLTRPSHSPPILTRSKQRCEATYEGHVCQEPARHGGLHFVENGEVVAAWDDRARPRSQPRRSA